MQTLQTVLFIPPSHRHAQTQKENTNVLNIKREGQMAALCKLEQEL
jgi:hypothetical protein